MILAEYKLVMLFKEIKEKNMVLAKDVSQISGIVWRPKRPIRKKPQFSLEWIHMELLW